MKISQNIVSVPLVFSSLFSVREPHTGQQSRCERESERMKSAEEDMENSHHHQIQSLSSSEGAQGSDVCCAKKSSPSQRERLEGKKKEKTLSESEKIVVKAILAYFLFLFSFTVEYSERGIKKLKALHAAFRSFALTGSPENCNTVHAVHVEQDFFFFESKTTLFKRHFFPFFFHSCLHETETLFSSCSRWLSP